MADVQTRAKINWGRLAIIAIALCFGTWVAVHLEWQDETTRSGFTGEARHNPYYAGMLLLEQSGYTARRLDDAIALDGLATRSTLLLNSPALFNNSKQAAKLLGWVQRGGHLVLPLSRRSNPDALLKAFGIQTHGWNDSSLRSQMIAVEDEPVHVDLRNAVVFDVSAESDWESTLAGYFDRQKNAVVDDDEDTPDKQDKAVPQRAFHTEKFAGIPANERETLTVYARWRLGQGTVTAGDFAPFRNGEIENSDHAGLFVTLMTLPGDKRPVFVALTAEYPGLGTWLAQHAGEALIALAVLLTALLWRAMPRFGPQLPDAVPKRPGLLEHLSAVGDFLLREKQYEALIAPLREDVVIRLTHLRGRHPEIGSLPELGAHIARLDVRDVSQALTPEPADAHEFLRRSRTLATLRKYCSSMQNAFSSEGNSP